MGSLPTTQSSKSGMTKTLILPFQFVETEHAKKVESLCRIWKGTPYRLNDCTPGVGVDCIHFVAAILDSLYGERHSKNLKSLPPDACVHNKLGVLKAGRALFAAYPGMERVEDSTLEAGDLVATGPAQKEPTVGHLMIAGGPGKLWQAISVGVCFTGYGIPDNQMLVAVYRATDKYKWLL